MFVQQAVAEVRPEIDFLVRTPCRGVAIRPPPDVIAGQEQRSVGQTMDRRGLAQRRVDGIGIVQKPGIETAKVKAADERDGQRLWSGPCPPGFRLCGAGAQQIVEVHDADRSPGIDHDQRGDLRVVEQLQRSLTS